MNQIIDIGDQLTFVHNGTSREGRVFGTEIIQGDRRRRSGLHLVIATGDRELVTIHESQIGSVVEPAA